MNKKAKEPQGTVTIDKNMIYRYGLRAAAFYAVAKKKKEEREKAGEVREDGFFKLTFNDVENEIDMGIYTQVKVVKQLADMGVLRVKRLGLPGRQYVCLDK